MRRLPLLIAICLTSSISAQHLSIGAYAGADLWLHKKYSYHVADYNWSFGKSLFVHWDRERRWSYEATFSHSAFSEHNESYSQVYDFPLVSDIFVTDDQSTRVYAIALKADYQLLKNATGRLRQYAGFQLRPTLWSQTSAENWYDSATLRPVLSLFNSTKQVFRFWMGLHYSVSYAINSRFDARMIATYVVDPYLLLREEQYAWIFNDPHSKATFDVGIGYRLR